MQLTPSTEQDELAATVRAFVGRRRSTEAIRATAEAGRLDRPLWEQLGRELDLPGLAVGLEQGGSGSGPGELAAAAGALGAALSAGPLVTSAAFATALLTAALEAGHGPAGEVLRDLAAAAAVATVAVVDEREQWTGPFDAASAAADGPGWTLRGTYLFVPFGADADVLLAVARTADGPGVFQVDPTGPGIRREPLETMDASRPTARLVATDAPAEPLLLGEAAGSALARAYDLALTVTAAEQAGAAATALDRTVAYAKERMQFDRPIGSFQAIKHLCADLFMDLAFARAAAAEAVAVLRDPAADPRSRALAASTAKAFCSEAYVRVATESIQVHGGIGFTWEHPAHLWFRHARSTAGDLGDPAFHRARIARLAGLTGSGEPTTVTP